MCICSPGKYTGLEDVEVEEMESRLDQVREDTKYWKARKAEAERSTKGR